MASTSSVEAPARDEASVPPRSATAAGLGGPAAILCAELPCLAAGRRAVLKSLLIVCGPLVGVEHADRLARVEEPAIFALNHSNYAEALLAPMVLLFLRRGRAVHFLADWMFLELPLLGPLLRLGEPIAVYGKRARFGWGEARRRQGRRQPALDRCLARLAAGGSLGLFPEGRRGGDPRRLLAPRPGLGELALRSAAPVVPIGIRHPAAARLGRAPRLGRMVLAVGEPVDLAAERALFAALAGVGAARAARRELARLAAARVMAALAALAGPGAPAERAHGRSQAATDRETVP